MQASILIHFVSIVKHAGANPVTVLVQCRRFWERVFVGSELGVFRLGPKDARLEIAGFPFAALTYNRVTFRGILESLVAPFCIKSFVRDAPELVAYRMLGSRSDADDAVQEAWLRLICLDMLRARKIRLEKPLAPCAKASERQEPGDPERDALLADSVGLALLVVLETLAPAERVALVLHDMCFHEPIDRVPRVLNRVAPSAVMSLLGRGRLATQYPWSGESAPHAHAIRNPTVIGVQSDVASCT